MAIRIVRNENGNCITFIGSSQPAYWNACLSGRVNEDDATRVDVINDVRTTDTNNPVFEFYAVDFNTFQDADGNSFDNAQACADYITEKANVLSSAIVLTATDNVNFSRDPTNTSILTSLGDNFGVNAIKAIEAADGTITIREFQDDSGQDLYRGLRPANTKIENQEQTLSITAVINSLNAHFSVNPVGLGIDDAVVSFLYSQQTPSITTFGNTTESAGVVTKVANTGSQRNDGFHTDSSGDTLIKNAGDYFQLNTSGYDFGRNFLFGLFNRNGISGGDSVFVDNNAAGGKLDLGLRLAPNAAFEDGPHGVVIEEGFFKDPQNSSLFRVGMNADRRLFISHFSSGTNEYQEVIRSAFPVDSGNEFLLTAYLFDSGASFNGGIVRNKLADSTTVAYRYIESPDGVYRYPLFATESEAGAVSIANGGNDSSEAHLFIDDPSGSTWHAPATGYISNGTSAPRDSGDVIYTEISSGVDAQFAPAPFTFPDYQFAENAAVNIQTLPAGASFNQTLSGVLPIELAYNTSTGYITGTTAYVSKQKTSSLTLTRSNAYGSTSANFLIAITNNATLDNINGITNYNGNTFQPDFIEQKSVMDSDYGFFADVEQKLERGTQVDFIAVPGDANAPAAPTYPYWSTPHIGIVDTTMDSADKAANSDTSTWAVSSSWDMRVVFHGNNVGGPNTSGRLIGFADNSFVSGGGFINMDKTFRLALSDSDGLIRLYRENGTDSTGNMAFDLLKTSADSYSTAQRLSLWTPSDYPSQRRRIPTYTFSTIGANDSTPSAGFESPLALGLMSTETIMGDGDSESIGASSAFLIDVLQPGQRFIVPQSWVEDNILDLMKDSGMGFTGNEGGKVFIGVPKTNAAEFDQPRDVNDFTAVNRWEYKKNDLFRLAQYAVYGSHVDDNVQVGPQIINVNSPNYENAYYDAAIEWDGEQFYVLQCNTSDVTQLPGVENGGSFTRMWGTDDSARTHSSGYNAYAADSAVPIAIAVNDKGRVRLQRHGLQIIDIPLTANDFVAHKDSAGAELTFNDSAIARSGLTLAAGYTYRFYENELADSARISFTTGGSEYNTGVTRKGSYPEYLNYTQIAVDSAVPPLKMVYNGDSGASITITGSSYTVPATGVTQEGPSANQTGDNFFDNGDYGWLSLDDTITAGQRLVLNSTFLQDLVDGMPDNTSVAFGIKDPNWTDHGNGIYSNTFANQFIGGAFIRVTRFPSNNSNRVKIYAGITGTGTSASQTIAFSYGTTVDTSSSAFIEISADGDQVNCGIHNVLSEANAASTPFAFWPEGGSTYDPPRKFTTGDQGYNISTADVMMIGGHASQGSTLGGAMAYDAVDWSLLSEINVPSLPTAITTNYAKALDFSGGSEYAKQTGSNNSYAPLRMSGFSTAIAAGTWNGSIGNTSSATSARPWAVTCVFKSDGNSSNQHIWNQGEGSATGDDNIYLRVSSTGQLFFGWGRDGALNELYLGTISSSNWYGVYVASTGERLTGNNASAVNLAGCFDIRLFSSATGWGMSEQLSTSTNWAASPSITGGRMDRTFAGDFTVGGRSNNRNFHGKIASCVVTTLRRGFTMPKSTERKMMTIDPKQWMQTYKVGQVYRLANSGGNGTWGLNNQNSSYATQVWLMGDGTNDAFSKIRNQAWPANQNNTTLDMNSMVSNDIETIDVDGLTD